MRPDTPEPTPNPFSIDEMNDEMLETVHHESQLLVDPDAISVEEMNARLLETARQESLREHMEAIAAEDLENEMDVEDRRITSTVHPNSLPPPSPSVEYNEHGQLAAGSKGKGRAR
jgi:hypothetical protein